MKSYNTTFVRFIGHAYSSIDELPACSEYIIYDKDSNRLDEFRKTVNNDKKFKFFHVDIINENERFLKLLDGLSLLRKKTCQYVNIDFDTIDTDAINNILHNLWLKNIKLYPSVVKIKNDEDYAGKLYTKLNPSFCILPWMHIQYKPSGQPKLCCRYDISLEANEAVKNPDSNNLLLKLSPAKDNITVKESSMEQSFFGDYWSASRQYTQDQTPLIGCHKCYKEEQGTQGEVQNSMRLGSSILYNQGYLHKQPNYEKPRLEFLEVGFGNYCNLACLSCNSSLSTSWYQDELELNKVVNNNVKRMIFPKLDNLKFIPDAETLKTLRVIKFTGGEPMINPEFTKFIELICEQGRPEQISLEIYTNCSYVPSPKLLENLTKFEAVQMNLSVDAYGAVNDYVRYGSNWTGNTKQTVSNAIDFWLTVGRDHGNISVIMSTTLSALNILEIPKLMSWWMDKYKDSGNKIVIRRELLLATEYDGFFKLQPAHDPSYINLNILPKDSYKDILEWINSYKENFTNLYPDLQGIPECIGASLLKLEQLITKATGNVDNGQDLLHYLDSMDKIRKNNAQEAIPDIVQRVKEYLLTQDTLQ
jgi:sulfatase maturation enzyme AslB (radical SAM superfamily)